MRKKLLSMLLALALCLGLAVPALAAPTFTDVPASHWAFGAIEEMAGRGVVNGVGDGKFEPEGEVTCANFSTMLARLLFAEELERHTDKTYWWQPYADTLLEAGVLDNTTAKAFYIRAMYRWDKAVMEQPMSRYDMAQIMYNALEAKGFAMPSGGELQAARAKIADYAAVPSDYAAAVTAMYALECLTGMDEAGNFRGGEKMRRCQACIVLSRLQDKLDAQPAAEPSAAPAPAPTPTPVPTPTPAPTSTPTPTPAPTPAPTPTPTPTPAPTPTPTPEPSPEPAAETGTDLNTIRNEMLALINQERAAAGADPLTLDDTLCQAAQARAVETVQVFSHTRPDGRSCFTAMDEAGVSYRAAGENIAAGQRSVAAVMDSWMNSTGHRANILSGKFGRVGIGLCLSNSGYGIYWVQMFAD